MKKERVKYVIIAVLVILLIVFSTLLIIKKNDKEVKTKVALEDSVLTEDEIYQEVYTEVLYGKEKYITHDEKGNRVNTSEKMKETVTVDGERDLEVEGIQITSKDNNTMISGTIKNTGRATLGDEILTISLKDDSGIEVLAVGMYVDEVPAGETTTFETAATTDLANAYSYSVSK